MSVLLALAAAAALVALASILGLVLRARSGRSRAAHGESAETVRVLGLDPAALGGEATLVQFTSEFCAQCAGAARRLDEIAAGYDGVRRVEVDLTHEPGIAAHFHVLQTPTTLILDASGSPVARIGGMPRVDAVRHHLDRLTGSPHVAA